MQFERTLKRKPRPDMMPMIDVVFFLLVFFMLFSTLKATPLGMDLELAKAVSGSAVQSKHFEVSINRDGMMYVDGKMVTGPELQAQLSIALQENPDLFVLFNNDRRLYWEDIAKALDHVRAVGAYRYAFAVEPEI